jgi:hypothetical protein
MFPCRNGLTRRPVSATMSFAVSFLNRAMFQNGFSRPFKNRRKNWVATLVARGVKIDPARQVCLIFPGCLLFTRLRRLWR